MAHKPRESKRNVCFKRKLVCFLYCYRVSWREHRHQL